MLVVVEDGNIHPLTTDFLNDETLWRFDVFKVDCAKCWLEGANDIRQLFRVGFVHFDVKAIDGCELLEQNRLAFHHGFGRKRTDVTQTQNRCPVGDNRNQIGA